MRRFKQRISMLLSGVMIVSLLAGAPLGNSSVVKAAADATVTDAAELPEQEDETVLQASVKAIEDAEVNELVATNYEIGGDGATNIRFHTYDYESQVADTEVGYGKLFSFTVPDGKVAKITAETGLRFSRFIIFDDIARNSEYPEIHETGETLYGNLSGDTKKAYMLWVFDENEENPSVKINISIEDVDKYYINAFDDKATVLTEGEQEYSRGDEIIYLNRWYEWDGEKDIVRCNVDGGRLFKYSLAPNAGVRLSLSGFGEDRGHCNCVVSNGDGMDLRPGRTAEYFNSSDETLTVYVAVQPHDDEIQNYTIKTEAFSGEDVALANHKEDAVVLSEGKNEVAYEGLYSALVPFLRYDPEKNEHISTNEMQTGLLLKITIPARTGVTIEADVVETEMRIYGSDISADTDIGNINNNDDRENKGTFFNDGEVADDIYLWVYTWRPEDAEEVVGVTVTFTSEEDLDIRKAFERAQVLNEGDNTVGSSAKIDFIDTYYDWETGEDMQALRTAYLVKLTIPKDKAADFVTDLKDENDNANIEFVLLDMDHVEKREVSSVEKFSCANSFDEDGEFYLAIAAWGNDRTPEPQSLKINVKFSDPEDATVDKFFDTAIPLVEGENHTDFEDAKDFYVKHFEESPEGTSFWYENYTGMIYSIEIPAGQTVEVSSNMNDEFTGYMFFHEYNDFEEADFWNGNSARLITNNSEEGTETHYLVVLQPWNFEADNPVITLTTVNTDDNKLINYAGDAVNLKLGNQKVRIDDPITALVPFGDEEGIHYNGETGQLFRLVLEDYENKVLIIRATDPEGEEWISMPIFNNLDDRPCGFVWEGGATTIDCVDLTPAEDNKMVLYFWPHLDNALTGFTLSIEAVDMADLTIDAMIERGEDRALELGRTLLHNKMYETVAYEKDDESEGYERIGEGTLFSYEINADETVVINAIPGKVEGEDDFFAVALFDEGEVKGILTPESGERFEFKNETGQHRKIGIYVIGIDNESYVEFDINIQRWPFGDVQVGDSGYEDIYDAYLKGIANGYGYNEAGITNFKAKKNVTRAQFAIMLYLTAKSMGLDVSVNPADVKNFADVPEGASGYEAISWASANGIINGYTKDGQTIFKPNNNIVRQQMALMLMNFAKKYGGDVSGRDAAVANAADYGKVGNGFGDAMSWAFANGILSGVTKKDGLYIRPDSYALRDQCAMFVMRFYRFMG
ncbi:MAG: S-layer homology domain-containing protein [Eubacterium sp.]|nr:S-layer homology domain-containing protein [Eubacterium sp.]